MKITIRTPKIQDYDRFSNIMDQVQKLHVDWRPDVYKPASPSDPQGKCLNRS